MKRLKFALILLASASAPVQSADFEIGKLTGTFTGAVTSGEEIIYPFFSRPPERFSLVGTTFVLIADIDATNESEGVSFDHLSMYVTGWGGNSGDGIQDEGFASLWYAYSNGVLRLTISGFDQGNDSGTAILLADLVDRQFVNWRGSVTMYGQTGPGEEWGMQATMPSLTFVGNLSGPIPEPATWAMMIAGFGLAGANFRRSKTIALG